MVQADLSVSANVAPMIDEARRALGEIDILVNNAGIIRPQPLDEISPRDWDELIATNLTSVFLATQQVVPHMRAQRWGRVINLSSVAAQLGGIVGPHYAASKAGLAGLTHSYAALLAKEGVTVNTISPALIETEMVTSNPRARADLIPVGRFGSVDEVAVRGRHAGRQRLHHGTDDQRQRGMVYDVGGEECEGERVRGCAR